MATTTKEVPRGACQFRAEISHLGDNGDGAKSAPVRLLARSSKPIEHYYWGKIAHDVSGFDLAGRERLPIDFDHDTGEAIGYVNKFEATPEGLVLSGALISTRDDDRADRVIRQSREGIPYEASINFAGEPLELEDVAEGETTQVNGYELAGPAIVARKWALRGVAVTLYGADRNTNTQVFSESDTVSARIFKHETEVDEMSADEVTETEAAEAVELSQTDAVEATETAPVETAADEAAELSQTVEPVEAEAAEAVEPEAAEVEEPTETTATFSQAEFVRIVTDFGAEIATETVSNGGTYDDALHLSHRKQAQELAELRDRVAELSKDNAKKSGASPATFADGENHKRKLSYADYWNTKHGK